MDKPTNKRIELVIVPADDGTKLGSANSISTSSEKEVEDASALRMLKQIERFSHELDTFTNKVRSYLTIRRELILGLSS